MILPTNMRQAKSLTLDIFKGSISVFTYVLLVYYLFCSLFVFALNTWFFLFSAVMFARALYKCHRPIVV